jgi:hypothetical protein
MSQGNSKKISELPTVNTVSSSDLIVVNANVSGNAITSAIAVNNFINSAIGNVYNYSNLVAYTSGNVVVVANGTENVAYFSYDRTIYSSAIVVFDMFSNSDSKRSFGTVVCTANATIANASSGGAMHVHIGGAPVINPQKSANVSGNTVSLYLDGPTGNVQVRYMATLFKV